MKINLPNPFNVTQMLPTELPDDPSEYPSLYTTFLDEPAKVLLIAVLKHTNFNYAESTRILGIDELFLRHLIDRYEIKHNVELPQMANVIDFVFYQKNKE